MTNEPKYRYSIGEQVITEGDPNHPLTVIDRFINYWGVESYQLLFQHNDAPCTFMLEGFALMPYEPDDLAALHADQRDLINNM